MEKEIERAIQYLCSLIKEGVSADDTLKYTQSALSLANTLRTMETASRGE